MLSVDWVRKTARNYPGIITKVTPRFLEEAGVIVQGSAKRIAPVDSGNLKGSITREKFHDRAEVGTNVEYAEHVEYGTKHMTAQPYLRPAIDENRKGLLRKLAELMRAEIQRGRN